MNYYGALLAWRMQARSSLLADQQGIVAAQFSALQQSSESPAHRGLADGLRIDGPFLRDPGRNFRDAHATVSVRTPADAAAMASMTGRGFGGLSHSMIGLSIHG